MGKARAEVEVPVRRQPRAGIGDGTGLVAPKILKMGLKGPTPEPPWLSGFRLSQRLLLTLRASTAETGVSTIPITFETMMKPQVSHCNATLPRVISASVNCHWAWQYLWSHLTLSIVLELGFPGFSSSEGGILFQTQGEMTT